jgi:predicted amidophosphoribosyltransferase
MPEDPTCAFCGKDSPIYTRCPRCKAQISKDYKTCPSCSQPLYVYCICCGKPTFFDVHCDACGKKIEVECPRCHAKQPPVSEKCSYCKKGQLPLVAKPVVS